MDHFVTVLRGMCLVVASVMFVIDQSGQLVTQVLSRISVYHVNLYLRYFVLKAMAGRIGYLKLSYNIILKDILS